eukprot:CAMPEP_0117494510 /NCGR_PEP_ID=MMETSP0784-20121206/19647_1 /TAXON_ID=39447 /ORGANISM="" /LENGTH=410 /DNA_ID=CAMNT_0005289389 /DNA_START=232 /DNA_END=1464 /DNA_ORIENTATION=+
MKASGLPVDEVALQMDCVSLAVMSLNIIAFATAYGFNGAVDAYAPVAFGAGKHIDMYLVLYRQLVMLAVFTLLLLLLLCNAEVLLVLAGQPADVAHGTGQILSYLALSVPGDFAYDCLGHWARSQQRQSLVTACASVGLVLNILVNFFCKDPNHPVMGPIAALVVQNTTLPFLLAAVLWRNSRAIRVPLRAVFDGIGPQFWTGLAQACWTCAELWAWEVQVIEAQVFGKGATASYVLISSTYSFLIMLPAGVCSGVVSLAGEALGAQRLQEAKYVLYMGCVHGLALVACYAIPLSLFRRWYASMVAGGVEAIESRVAAILPIILITHAGDAIFNVTKSWLTLRQHQLFGAIQSLFVYYAVGLPLGWWLAVRCDYDLAGLWVGLSVAVVLGTAACVLRTYLDLRELAAVAN